MAEMSFTVLRVRSAAKATGELLRETYDNR
jgi:hypothetical protein